MIDPISAFAAVSAGHAAIKKAVEMGKDLGSLSGAISSYAKGEAELQFGENRKKSSRFSVAEDSAIEKHFKKEKMRQMRDELRSIFMLYGTMGQWERLQAEIASERARINRELQERARKIDLIKKIAVASIVFTSGLGILILWVLYLRGDLSA